MTSDDFWTRKLAKPQNTTPPPSTDTRRRWWDTTPQQTPLDTPLPPTQHVPLPNPKAQSANLNSKCPAPDCRSSNYMPFTDKLGTAWKCFDCGYPIVQTTSGTGIANIPGQSTQPSRQIPHGGLTNNFNPGAIIAHA